VRVVLVHDRAGERDATAIRSSCARSAAGGAADRLEHRAVRDAV